MSQRVVSQALPRGERAVSRNGVAGPADRARSGSAGYSSAMLHLASRSPRRSELLARLGVAFGVLDLDIPEQRQPGEAAEEYVRRVARARHSPQGPDRTAAPIELGLATPSYVICEAVTSDVPWRAEVASESHPIDRDGMLARPSGRPGLGIEIDLDVVARHPFEPGVPQRVFYRDGSVGDW